MLVNPSSSKAYQAMCYLLTLKTVYRVALIGIFTVVTLFLFATLIDAIAELTAHIAQIWNAAGSIERLIILVCGVLLFRWLSPAAVKIWKRKGF